MGQNKTPCSCFVLSKINNYNQQFYNDNLSIIDSNLPITKQLSEKNQLLLQPINIVAFLPLLMCINAFLCVQVLPTQ